MILRVPIRTGDGVALAWTWAGEAVTAPSAETHLANVATAFGVSPATLTLREFTTTDGEVDRVRAELRTATTTLPDGSVRAVVAAPTPAGDPWQKFAAARALTVTFGSTETTKAVTFPVALPDTNYVILPGAVNRVTGTPAALAFLAQATNLTTTGFTARLGAAPGGTATVTVTFVGVKVAG